MAAAIAASPPSRGRRPSSSRDRLGQLKSMTEGARLRPANSGDRSVTMLMRRLGRPGSGVRAVPGGNTSVDHRPEASEAVLDASARRAATSSTPPTSTRAGRRQQGRGVGDCARPLMADRRTRGGADRHQGLRADGTGAERQGPLADAHRGGVEASLRRSRPTTSISTRRTGRRGDAARGDAARLRRPRAPGQGRYIGASNYPAWRLTRALWEPTGPPPCARVPAQVQPVIRDEYERELEPLCREQEVGVIPYSSLASGFLSGKYHSGEPLPKTARAGGVRRPT